MIDDQINSKERVRDFGEVFTPSHIVSDMLDLVKEETERIESKFLEPACGNGNFLVEILRRKLEVVKNKYKKIQLEYEKNSIIAISSIYGVDILEDNVKEAQNRLFEIFEAEYLKLYKKNYKQECLESFKFILEKNIIHGDTLTQKLIKNREQPIIFSEWAMISDGMIKRKEYSLDSLLKKTKVKSLFNDEGTKAIIHKAQKNYPLKHFLKLVEYDQ